jgi:hypothetical protein
MTSDRGGVAMSARGYFLYRQRQRTCLCRLL